MSIKCCERIYYNYLNNSDFLTLYGKSLLKDNQIEKACLMLEKANSISSNTVINISLGDSYQQMKNYVKAEKAYLKACYMVPNRFYPKYLLAKLYEETSEEKKALSVAEELLNKEIKVHSTAIDEIKEEMIRIINKYK